MVEKSYTFKQGDKDFCYGFNNAGPLKVFSGSWARSDQGWKITG